MSGACGEGYDAAAEHMFPQRQISNGQGEQKLDKIFVLSLIDN